MSVVHFVVSFFATGHCVVILLNFLSTALSLIKQAALQASMIKNIPTVFFFFFFCACSCVVHVLYSVVDIDADIFSSIKRIRQCLGGIYGT